jgi:hypothetical protein
MLDPTPRALEHPVSYVAKDGSMWVYSLHVYVDNENKNYYRLFASPDAGLTWQERGQQFGKNLLGLMVAEADGRVLYAVTGEKGEIDPRQLNYTVYFSPDAGATWEKRHQNSITGIYFLPTVYPYSIQGHTSPVDFLQLYLTNGGAGSSGRSYYIYSIDGGRTFNEFGSFGFDTRSQLLYSNQGFLQFTSIGRYSYKLARSSDNGKTWVNLPLPYTPSLTEATSTGYMEVLNMPGAPDNLILKTGPGTGDLWYSPDAGSNWSKIGANLQSVRFSPYSPYFLLGISSDNQVYTLDLGRAGHTLTGGVAASKAAGTDFYTETRHNLGGIFKDYWASKGGLAQFGFPKTEKFRELNPSDGKIYTVQYFERNRFEYHPENAGTPYEVLLGLLGVQLTEDKRTGGHGAFNRFDNMNYPGGIYFPETGHNLRNSFKVYWEANGGLPIFGFPISEEYLEVNPDDGKTYVMQYFERNRFEWHPENTGTRYEVLLGLLGNALLRQKGWL